MSEFIGHAISVFLGLTGGSAPSTRRKIAVKALVLSFVIVVFFAAAGKLVFELFSITLSAFFAFCIITYYFFISGERFINYIGDNGVKVVTRLMG